MSTSLEKAHSASAIKEIVDTASRIKCGEHEAVKPGQPVIITGAETPDRDGYRQGDIYVKILSEESFEKLFKQYKEVDLVAEGPAAKQLVPDNTQGAKHCLESLDGVKMARPNGWGPGYDELLGPVFLLPAGGQVTHPVHGPVVNDSGRDVLLECLYQRELDAEQKRERRARDQ